MRDDDEASFDTAAPTLPRRLPRWQSKKRRKKDNQPTRPSRWRGKKKRNDDDPKPKRLVRQHEAMKRLGVGRTKFAEDVVEAGLLKMFPIGPRAKACLESDLDNLIDGIAAGKICLGQEKETDRD